MRVNRKLGRKAQSNIALGIGTEIVREERGEGGRGMSKGEGVREKGEGLGRERERGRRERGDGGRPVEQYYQNEHLRHSSRME